MEFDLSKENIQPLRGGRNVSLLEVGLQAQSNEEFQRELVQQKEEFERTIQNYDGDDPLDNWYHYICWVEQSYPKHGHEGNLVPLLEDCLAKFENDKRYANDFRFCKLWIKYNDLQQNPLELYHMMHARGLCRGCADLYRAWAYYHEAAGDYRNADVVFQLGKRELAQPYEELIMAHQNLVYAAGQQVINGVNEQRLLEQRQALTTLRTYRPGRVGSVRSASSTGAGVLPSGAAGARPNSIVPVYEDKGDSLRGAEAPPISILSVAKRQVAPKENTIKPGTWTSAGPQLKNMRVQHRAPQFTVHEDVGELEPKGLKLPIDHYPITHEDFSQWKPTLCYAEPEDPSRLPMYPKAKVYSSSETEFSIEEIRGCRYIPRAGNRLNVSHIETVQAIQSILSDNANTINKQRMHEFSQVDGHFYNQQPNVYQQEAAACNQSHVNVNLYQHEQPVVFQGDGYQQACGGPFSPQLQQNVLQQPVQYINSSQSHVHEPQQQHHAHFGHVSQIYQPSPFHQSPLQHGISHHSPLQQDISHHSPLQQGISHHSPLQQDISHHSPLQPDISHHSIIQHGNSIHQETKMPPRIFGQDMREDVAATSFHSYPMAQENKTLGNEQTLTTDMNVLWRSTSEDDSIHQPRPNISKFAIYEESTNLQENLQPKGSAMKTMPFKILSDEELAETGSRGGHDIAAAAQPGDGAKRIEIYEDDSSSSFSDAVKPTTARYPELNDTCNTQVFNFNLNVMHVSTPQSKQISPSAAPGDDAAESARKQLFAAEEEKTRMSTILEETKSYGSSSGSQCTTVKSFSHSKKENMTAISEENSSYHYNLAQNLKANAALRTTLLDLMDCESGQSSPVLETPVAPLDQVPSNPFRPAWLRSLLTHVGFPGRHSEAYVRIHSTPRIVVRKEVTYIGEDPYVVEKAVGKGTYGQIFKATDARTNRPVALKMQKPPNCWEFYICRELQARLAKHPLKECFMDVQTGYFSDQISVFVSTFSPCGSLLDVANNYRLKAGYSMKQAPCVYFCVEMLNIVSAMHQVKIIHADIKPDNFLVYVLADGSIQLQLIDFGCSIDMTLYPQDAMFTRRVTTKDFICCEMLDSRPWSYHTDLFCVAATAHVLLFDKYMQLQKKGDQWSITQRFTRYMRVDLWNTFFSTLLNQQRGPADSGKLIAFMTEALNSFGQDLSTEMRKIINIVNNR